MLTSFFWEKSCCVDQDIISEAVFVGLQPSQPHSLLVLAPRTNAVVAVEFMPAESRISSIAKLAMEQRAPLFDGRRSCGRSLRLFALLEKRDVEQSTNLVIN
jgi:hypothetical protein